MLGTATVFGVSIANWELEALVQLFLAALLGGMVGLEREYRGRAAGFRTNALVGMGCCLVMLVSLHFARLFPLPLYDQQSVLRVDPARIAYGVMAGMGFLGAGAIIRSGAGIRGLTTAASMWCMAAIGLAIGAQMYVVGVVAAVLVMFILFGLNYIEGKVRRRWYKTIRITCRDGAHDLEKFQDMLTSHGIRVLDVQFNRDIVAGKMEMTFNARLPERSMAANIHTWVAGEEDVLAVAVL